jgi:hypothetical protein
MCQWILLTTLKLSITSWLDKKTIDGIEVLGPLLGFY